MQVDQRGVEVEKIEATPFVAPPLRIFEVAVAKGREGEEVTIYVSAHMVSVNNPQGHAVFSDFTDSGSCRIHRIVPAGILRDVQELGIIAAGRETVN